jgi:hypothetical protein
MRFEYTSLVLNFEEKSFSLTRAALLAGLAPKSAKAANDLGADGWELVSVIPYVGSAPRVVGQPGTEAAVGFFKRAKA